MNLELSDADITILADLLKRTIDDDRYPLSPRVTRLREILAKLRPEPVREPPPAEGLCAAASKRSQETPVVKLPPPKPGEQRYAVAIRDGSDLWLTLWVRCSEKGDIYVILPRADPDFDVHTSYHRNGKFHTKTLLPSIAWSLMAGAIRLAHLKSGNIWLGVCEWTVFGLLEMYIYTNVERMGILTLVPEERLYNKNLIISAIVSLIFTILLWFGGLYLVSAISKALVELQMRGGS
jgi:hypothetical protein